MVPGGRKQKCADIRILIRILTVLHEYGEQRPTKLAWSSDMSYNIMQSCLRTLKKNGLVTVTKMEDGHDTVKITIEGIELLEDYRQRFSKLLDDR